MRGVNEWKAKELWSERGREEQEDFVYMGECVGELKIAWLSA